MQLDQAVLEHHSLGIVETAEGPRTRVVLVAARREMIDRLLEATRKAGLRPQGIDLSAFAMIRALHHAGHDRRDAVHQHRRDHQPGRRGGFDVRVHACPRTGHRDDGRRARRASRPHARPRQRLAQARRPAGGRSTSIEGDPDIVSEARSVLADGVRRISDELRNSLDFHAMQAGASGVERAILTGAAAAIPGFADQLGDELGRPVSVGAVARGPARRVQRNRRRPPRGRRGSDGLRGPGMKAVNLIPADAKRGSRGPSGAKGLPTYLLLGAAGDRRRRWSRCTCWPRTTSRSARPRSTTLQAEVAQVQAQSSSLSHYAQFSQMAQARIALGPPAGHEPL